MHITSEEDIRKLVESDVWMMRVLRAAEQLDLPDWWIGAGFLRNKVWDAIEDKEAHPSRDVDLVYFNLADTRPETDWSYDEKMKGAFTFAEWEVRNQARMHYISGFPPFTSTADAISHWIETATCVAVKLESGQLKFLFCYGLNDLCGLIARPIDSYKTPERVGAFHKRVDGKQWRKAWPRLRVILD